MPMFWQWCDCKLGAPCTWPLTQILFLVVGGLMGVFLGMSIITLFEVFQLLFQSCICAVRYLVWKKGPQNLTNPPESHSNESKSHQRCTRPQIYGAPSGQLCNGLKGTSFDDPLKANIPGVQPRSSPAFPDRRKMEENGSYIPSSGFSIGIDYSFHI